MAADAQEVTLRPATADTCAARGQEGGKSGIPGLVVLAAGAAYLAWLSYARYRALYDLSKTPPGRVSPWDCPKGTANLHRFLWTKAPPGEVSPWD